MVEEQKSRLRKRNRNKLRLFERPSVRPTVVVVAVNAEVQTETKPTNPPRSPKNSIATAKPYHLPGAFGLTFREWTRAIPSPRTFTFDEAR